MSTEFVGLSSTEASLRSENFGLNEISSKSKKSALKILTSQFVSPLVLILVAASGLSAILNEWIDAIAIAVILFLNALIGFFQEYRAEKAIRALKEIAAPRASVMRDGKQSIIQATEIVVGDCLLLEAGDVVAADAKIIECTHLQINESILTGESVPVEKQSYPDPQDSQVPERGGIVFMGTGVATGTAQTEVISIGMATELGKIAKLITTAESPRTPLQLELSKVGKTLLILCLGVVLLVLPYLCT